MRGARIPVVRYAFLYWIAPASWPHLGSCYCSPCWLPSVSHNSGHWLPASAAMSRPRGPKGIKFSIWDDVYSNMDKGTQGNKLGHGYQLPLLFLACTANIRAVPEIILRGGTGSFLSCGGRVFCWQRVRGVGDLSDQSCPGGLGVNLSWGSRRIWSIVGRG